jgi:hypothetical protein
VFQVKSKDFAGFFIESLDLIHFCLEENAANYAIIFTRRHYARFRACLKIAFGKLCATVCRNEFSNTL